MSTHWIDMDIKTYNSLNALRTYLHKCYSNIFNNNTSMRKDCLATTEPKDYMSTICIHIQYDIFFHVPINNVLSFTKHNRLQHIPKSPHTQRCNTQKIAAAKYETEHMTNIKIYNSVHAVITRNTMFDNTPIIKKHILCSTTKYICTHFYYP